jgi:hypothetical protein
MFGSNTKRPHDHASAILEINANMRPYALQEERDKAITILRLFDIGSVGYLRTMFEAKTYDTTASCTFFTLQGPTGTLKYQVSNIDTERLKSLWLLLYSKLPPYTYELQKGVPDAWSIAFERYSDSILRNELIEKRIASAIMGLESLLSRENQEITYRLGKRSAKLLEQAGYQPLRVDKVIKEAYTIRSSYVHGSHLSPKDTAKMLKKFDMADIKEFLRELLHYLRICLIIIISLDLAKDNVIELLDNSLIDSNSHRRLEGLVKPIKKVL